MLRATLLRRSKVAVVTSYGVAHVRLSVAHILMVSVVKRAYLSSRRWILYKTMLADLISIALIADNIFSYVLRRNTRGLSCGYRLTFATLQLNKF